MTTDGSIQLRRQIMSFVVSRAIFAMHELGVPDHLAAGPRTARELAHEVGANEDALRRFLRVLVAEHLFTEDASGAFRLTSTGSFLRSDVAGSLASLVDLMGGEAYQVWDRVVHSVRTGEAAFSTVFGASYFDWLADHPEVADRFAVGQAGLVGARTQCVVDRDWAGVRTVVDVGGGNGSLLLRLLERHPEIAGTVVDLPPVAAEAAAAARRHGLDDRMTAVGGDFFTAVPAGGDVYVMAQILHDWDDASAARILGTCRTAMPGHARLVIVEQILPDRATTHPMALLDLHMLVLLGGRERTERQWRELLSTSGFELLSVDKGARASMLEAVPT